MFDEQTSVAVADAIAWLSWGDESLATQIFKNPSPIEFAEVWMRVTDYGYHAEETLQWGAQRLSDMRKQWVDHALAQIRLEKQTPSH